MSRPEKVVAVLVEPHEVQAQQRRLGQVEATCPFPLGDALNPLLLLLRGDAAEILKVPREVDPIEDDLERFG